MQRGFTPCSFIVSLRSHIPCLAALIKLIKLIINMKKQKSSFLHSCLLSAQKPSLPHFEKKKTKSTRNAKRHRSSFLHSRLLPRTVHSLAASQKTLNQRPKGFTPLSLIFISCSHTHCLAAFFTGFKLSVAIAW